MYSIYSGFKDNEITVHTWDKSFLFLKRILITLLFTGITGMSAKIRLYLPFTPVPVTGQVFAVLLCGAFLGKDYGPLSQIFYVLFGLLGVPWFVIGPFGPTGGYLIGFIFAPFIIGFLRENLRDGVTTTLLSMLAGVLIIYLFGLIQFSIFTQSNLVRSIPLAVLPFIPFDLGKALIAAFVSQILLRKLRALPL